MIRLTHFFHKGATPDQPKLKKGECGHAFHPASVILVEISKLCPVCHVNRILKVLEVRTEIWLRQGAPWPESVDRNDIGKSFGYTAARQRWLAIKVMLVKYTYTLEIASDIERVWAAEHPGVIEGMGRKATNIRSAKAALAVTRMQQPLNEVLESDFETNERPKKDENDRCVRFAEDTMQNAKRMNNRFKRCHEEYIPGRWAAPSENPWLNTSFCSLGQSQQSAYEAELDIIWPRTAN